MAEYGKVWSGASLEKILLIGLLFVIFASILPETELSSLALFIWVGLFVLLNTAAALYVVRRNWSTESVLAAFGARLVLNVGILGVTDVVMGVESSFRDAIFFLFLFTVLVTLYDRYRPVYEFRRNVLPTLQASSATETLRLKGWRPWPPPLQCFCSHDG